MKELDVLLERYATAVLSRAGAAERRVLASLLERPDPELAGYLLGGIQPQEAEIARIVARITALAAESPSAGGGAKELGA